MKAIAKYFRRFADMLDPPPARTVYSIWVDGKFSKTDLESLAMRFDRTPLVGPLVVANQKV